LPVRGALRSLIKFALPVRGALRSLINLPLAPMIAGDTSFARPIYAW